MMTDDDDYIARREDPRPSNDAADNHWSLLSLRSLEKELLLATGRGLELWELTGVLTL